MKNEFSKLRVAAVLLLAAALTGCGAWSKVAGEKVDYKQSRSEPALELPPDLDSAGIEEALVVPGSGSTTYSDYAGDDRRPAVSGTQTAVLYQPSNMHIERNGDQRWLVVQAPPEAIWPKLRDYWLQAGFILTVDDPSVGILETDWAENRADIPQDFVRRTIGKALDFMYSSATRDRFRVRLERAEGGQTEIFLTHRGMEEVMQGGSQNETGTIWQPRPSDPELEAEMLRRLMVYLGSEEEKAAAQLAQQPAPGRAPLAQLTVAADGATALVVEDGFSRAWRQVGLALDRVGFTVEDRDRSNGVYFVRYDDPLKEESKGILSKLAFWSDDEPEAAEQYRVVLLAEGERTRVTVQTADAKPDNSPTAKRILTLIQEQLQ